MRKYSSPLSTASGRAHCVLDVPASREVDAMLVPCVHLPPLFYRLSKGAHGKPMADEAALRAQLTAVTELLQAYQAKCVRSRAPDHNLPPGVRPSGLSRTRRVGPGWY